MKNDHSRPGRVALIGSVVLHAVFFGLLFSGVVLGKPAPPPNIFKAYRVKLVAAPPPAPVVKETPASKSEPKPVPPTPKAKPKAKPAPKKPQPKPTEEKAESKEQPAGKPTEDETSGAGKDALDMSMEGLEFAYPDYLANIITQIHRYFRWTGTARLFCEVYFVINRDGSVGDIRLVRRSGSDLFDYEAIGAIEQAGRRRAFGPLPKDFPSDRLPMRFTFSPSR